MQLTNPPVPYYREVIRAVKVSESMTAFRLDQFEALKRGPLAHCPAPSVLEVGAGRGDYAALLSRVFGNVTATELSADAARAGRGQPGVHMVETHPDLPTFHEDLGSRTFDLICCFSYLEHLPDPVTALNSIRRLAHENTLFLLEVPNSHFIFKHGLVNELIPDHLTYFTGTTLTQTLAHAGVEVVSLTEVWSGYILSAICRPLQADVVPMLVKSLGTLRGALDEALASTSPNAIVAVWGAGHQALFTIATTALRERTRYIVDSAPFKQHMRAPGSGLPVYAPAKLQEDPPDVLFVACAGFNAEVYREVRRMNLKARVFFIAGLTVEAAT